MEPINETKLSGQVIKVYPLRHTPYGLPVLSFVLEHISNQIEAGESRLVKCKMYCIIINSDNNLEDGLIDQFVVVSGFLSHNTKSQVILNVKQIYKNIN